MVPRGGWTSGCDDIPRPPYIAICSISGGLSKSKRISQTNLETEFMQPQTGNSHRRTGFTQEADQITGLLGVVGGEVSVRDTLGTGTTCTTDSVDVVLDVVGETVKKWEHQDRVFRGLIERCRLTRS